MANEKWKAQRFRLNFVPEGPPPRVRVHQYTAGTVMELHGEMFYGTEPQNMQDAIDEWFSEEVDQNGHVTFAFRRGDGKKFSYYMDDPHDTLFADDSIFYFPLDPRMTAAPGPCVMSIGFDDGSGGNVLWTQNFIIDVEPAPVRDTDLEVNINDDTIFDYIDQTVENEVSSEMDVINFAVDSSGYLYLSKG